MAEISRAAGVSHLIIYRHFASKEALYRAVLARASEILRSSLSAEGSSGKYGPTPAALVVAARSDPDSFRVLWRHAAREPEFSPFVDDQRTYLESAIRISLKARVAPEHLVWATRATLTLVLETLLVWIEEGDERLDDRFVRATEAAIRAGVRSWSAPDGHANPVQRHRAT